MVVYVVSLGVLDEIKGIVKQAFETNFNFSQ